MGKLDNMDTTDKEHHIFHWKLLKLMGLYHILKPSTFTIYGFNVYAIFLFFVFLAPLTVITFTMCPIGIHDLRNDIVSFGYNILLLAIFFLSCHKAIILLCYANKMWKCFEISKLHFLSHQNYNRSIFKYWQRRTYRDTTIIFVIHIIPFCLWCGSPYIFTNTYHTVRQLDGSIDKFRLNIFNVHTVVSSKTYNDHFGMFYCMELLVITSYVFFSFVFDELLVMMSYSFCCQFETVCNGIEVLGHRPRLDDDVLSINNATILRAKRDVYDELKAIIIDHQKVMRTMTDFYTIVRPEALNRIFVLSSVHVIIWFIMALTFLGVEASDSILTIKIIFTIPVFGFEKFVTCYLFETISDYKEAIVYALYSSNWTEMEKKSKDLILLAMLMNNANNLKVKLTSMKIVNLELFAGTMRTCYSICSVLINYSKTV